MKKMMNLKWIACVAIVFMGISFTSCSKDEPEPTDPVQVDPPKPGATTNMIKVSETAYMINGQTVIAPADSVDMINPHKYNPKEAIVEATAKLFKAMGYNLPTGEIPAYISFKNAENGQIEILKYNSDRSMSRELSFDREIKYPGGDSRYGLFTISAPEKDGAIATIYCSESSVLNQKDGMSFGIMPFGGQAYLEGDKIVVEDGEPSYATYPKMEYIKKADGVVRELHHASASNDKTNTLSGIRVLSGVPKAQQQN